MKTFFLLFLISPIILAQSPSRSYVSNKITKDGLEIKVSDGVYYIHFKSDDICENTFVPTKQIENKTSHAVVLNSKIKPSVQKNNQFLQLNSKSLAIKIQFKPFQISYLKNGETFLSEKNGYTQKDSTEVLDFNISSDEVLYGGGARAVGMNRRGNRLQLYNRAQYGYETRAELMNFCIPMVLSSKLYAIHFDNPAIGYLDLDSKKTNTLLYETISGRKTYQVLVGNTWADVLSNYTLLTGKQPLPPRWAFGNLASRFGYHSQEEVEKTIRKYEENKIPVDAIIIDLYWFGKSIKGTMGNLDWDKDTFPNPSKMIGNLNAKNIKTVLITEPFVLSTSSKWQEAVDKKVLALDQNGKAAQWDFYFGNTGIVDIFKPEGKSWFWNVYKELINQGVGGLWGDLGEPEVFPSNVITVGGKADEVHNVYGHNWAKLIQEGYQKEFPSIRPFILMRAGYSGSQRFGMIPWSGDVSRSWGGLQSQTEIALQMGMQGMAYMHSDLGGFAGDYFDNELYLRWLQYGVFNPVFRPHASEDVASEPVYKDIVTREKAKKIVELRYQLLPYIYTIGFENTQTGLPLMRPMFFEEPTNQKYLSTSDTYFWGNDFLVKPITTAAVTTTEINFPKNNNWFDFYSNKKCEAGSIQTIAVNPDTIPTFVRGGAFIPMIATIQNTANYSISSFDLHYFFDEKTKNSSGKLYHDDGKTPNAFENGEYELLTFKSKVEEKTVSITIYSEVGKKYSASEKMITFKLHNLNPKKVTCDGKTLAFKNTLDSTEIQFQLKKSPLQNIKIEY